MNLTKSYWEQYISEIGLPELPLVEVNLKNFDKKYIQDLYLNMDSVFSQFLEFCSKKHVDQLIKSGFRSFDLDLMEKGICPHSASIMLKIPLEYGGDIEVENMYIVLKNPFQFFISHFLSYQINTFNNNLLSGNNNTLPKTLFTPYPKGVSFVPALRTLKGFGGLSQGGKSLQLASQIEQDKIKQTKENNRILAQQRLIKLAATKKSKGK